MRLSMKRFSCAIRAEASCAQKNARLEQRRHPRFLGGERDGLRLRVALGQPSRLAAEALGHPVHRSHREEGKTL